MTDTHTLGLVETDRRTMWQCDTLGSWHFFLSYSSVFRFKSLKRGYSFCLPRKPSPPKIIFKVKAWPCLPPILSLLWRWLAFVVTESADLLSVWCRHWRSRAVMPGLLKHWQCEEFLQPVQSVRNSSVTSHELLLHWINWRLKAWIIH